MKLDKEAEVKTEKKTKYTYTFKPTLTPWDKKVKLVVTTEDPFEDMGKLDLTQNIGDIILVDTKVKETQTKIDPDKTEK